MDVALESCDPRRLSGLLDTETVSPAVSLTEGPGARIGRYKLLQLIGEGGFGSVFMAEQETPVVRKVALKIIKLGMDTKQVIARFQAERQALAMMDHPNIAKVFDAGATETGRPYFVMELVKGIPITDFCNQHHLPARNRLELCIEVCKAIQHAHQKGVIHRDLKPSNVMVTLHDGTPVPKVIDFGIAKATNQRLTEQTLFTEFRLFIGTPHYMPPEQADISGLDVDTRADIYSLGVLLYELLTNTTPFDPQQLRSSAYVEVQRIIREVQPPKPSTRLSTLGAELVTIATRMGTEPKKLNQLVSGELDWIVMKCLEKDRSRRYDTASALARDLQRYLNDEPVEASPPSAADKFRRFVRKHRLGLSVGTGFVLTLLLATALSSWQAMRATRATAVVVAERQRADEQAKAAGAARAAAEVNLADALIAQGDALGATGQWRVAKEKFHQAIDLLRANRQSSFLAEIALWDANRRSPSPLMEFPAHDGEVTHLRFIPGGEHLATIGSDGVARFWDARTGRLIRTIRGLGDVQRLSISPDGKLISFAAMTSEVTLWQIADGTLAKTIHGFSGRASAVTFSGDGRHILIGSADPPYELCLFDVSSGALIRKFMGHEAAIRDVVFTPDGSKAVSSDGRPPGDKIGFGFHVTIRAWNVDTGALLWKQIADKEERLGGALAISPDGEEVACTCWDGYCKVWDVATGAGPRLLGSDFGRDVQGVAYSAKRLLAWGAAAGSINVASDKNSQLWEFKHFGGHPGETRTLDFSSDARLLASGGGDGVVRIWPVYAGGETRLFPDNWARGEIAQVPSVVLSSDARLVLSSSPEDQLVRLWDVPSGMELGHVVTAGSHTSAAFGPANSTIVLIERDGRIGIWDQTLKHRLRWIEPPAGRMFDSLALSPDGQTLLACFKDGGDAVVCRTATGTIVKKLELAGPAGTAEVARATNLHRYQNERRFVFAPDGKFAVGLARDANVLKIWGTGDWREWHALAVTRPTRAAISGDSKWVACVGADVRVFDAKSGELRNHFNEAADQLSAVAFLPDCHFLVTEGPPGDGLVLWDLEKNSRVRPIGQSSFVFDMAASGDGTFIWSQRLREKRGAVNVANLNWVAKYDELRPCLERARVRLQADPDDAQALTALAEWYAFRDMPDWAVQLLERAGQPAAEAQLFELSRLRAQTENPHARARIAQNSDDPATNPRGGPFAAAIYDLTVELAQQPSNVALLTARGRFYARAGLFADAAADFMTVARLAPDDHLSWHQGVPLLLQAGNIDGYRHWRTVELQQFSGAADKDVGHRVAKDALMIPAEGEDLKRAVDLADRALAADGSSWGAAQTKGMAEYRSGHFEEAIPFLKKCCQLTHEARFASVAEFFLAMSYERSGDHQQGLAALERGQKSLAELPISGENDENFGNSDWILAHLASREAEEVVNQPVPTTEPSRPM